LVVGTVWTAFGIRYIVSSAQDIASSRDDELLMYGFVSLCLFSIEVIPFAIARASYDDDVTRAIVLAGKRNIQFEDQFRGL